MSAGDHLYLMSSPTYTDWAKTATAPGDAMTTAWLHSLHRGSLILLLVLIPLNLFIVYDMFWKRRRPLFGPAGGLIPVGPGGSAAAAAKAAALGLGKRPFPTECMVAAITAASPFAIAWHVLILYGTDPITGGVDTGMSTMTALGLSRVHPLVTYLVLCTRNVFQTLAAAVHLVGVLHTIPVFMADPAYKAAAARAAAPDEMLRAAGFVRRTGIRATVAKFILHDLPLPSPATLQRVLVATLTTHFALIIGFSTLLGVADKETVWAAAHAGLWGSWIVTLTVLGGAAWLYFIKILWVVDRNERDRRQVLSPGHNADGAAVAAVPGSDVMPVAHPRPLQSFHPGSSIAQSAYHPGPGPRHAGAPGGPGVAWTDEKSRTPSPDVAEGAHAVRSDSTYAAGSYFSASALPPVSAPTRVLSPSVRGLPPTSNLSFDDAWAAAASTSATAIDRHVPIGQPIPTPPPHLSGGGVPLRSPVSEKPRTASAASTTASYASRPPLSPIMVRAYTPHPSGGTGGRTPLSPQSPPPAPGQGGGSGSTGRLGPAAERAAAALRNTLTASSHRLLALRQLRLMAVMVPGFCLTIAVLSVMNLLAVATRAPTSSWVWVVPAVAQAVAGASAQATVVIPMGVLVVHAALVRHEADRQRVAMARLSQQQSGLGGAGAGGQTSTMGPSESRW
ncbi:hypothetical protein BC828DRAFT_388180 [Blastocladiella britannica]|nr:hypothetical protein BC828DRAFT_388180 [Blastocladiella britannica]